MSSETEDQKSCNKTERLVYVEDQGDPFSEK